MIYALYVTTFAVPLLFLWQYRSGRRLAVTGYHDLLYIQSHRRAADAVGVLIALIALLVVATIVVGPHGEQDAGLRAAHMTFALSFLALWLLIRFKFTGLYLVLTHQRLVYPYFACGLGTILTGVMRIHNLPG